MKAKKVLIITNIPNAYRIPLFNEIKKQLVDIDVELKVVFGTRGFNKIKSVVDLKDCQFDYQILRSIHLPFLDKEKIVCTYNGLYSIIRAYQPDKIVTIGYSIATTKLWLRSFFKKTPYVIWSGSIAKQGHLDSFARKTQRSILLQRAIGAIAYGTKAKEYFQSMGMPEDKITIAINNRRA